jgi:hypothetical protein
MNGFCNSVIRELHSVSVAETHKKQLQPIARENARSG